MLEEYKSKSMSSNSSDDSQSNKRSTLHVQDFGIIHPNIGESDTALSFTCLPNRVWHVHSSMLGTCYSPSADAAEPSLMSRITLTQRQRTLLMPESGIAMVQGSRNDLPRNFHGIPVAVQAARIDVALHMLYFGAKECTDLRTLVTVLQVLQTWGLDDESERVNGIVLQAQHVMDEYEKSSSGKRWKHGSSDSSHHQTLDSTKVRFKTKSSSECEGQTSDSTNVRFKTKSSSECTGEFVFDDSSPGVPISGRGDTPFSNHPRSHSSRRHNSCHSAIQQNRNSDKNCCPLRRQESYPINHQRDNRPLSNKPAFDEIPVPCKAQHVAKETYKFESHTKNVDCSKPPWKPSEAISSSKQHVGNTQLVLRNHDVAISDCQEKVSELWHDRNQYVDLLQRVRTFIQHVDESRQEEEASRSKLEAKNERLRKLLELKVNEASKLAEQVHYLQEQKQESKKKNIKELAADGLSRSGELVRMAKAKAHRKKQEPVKLRKCQSACKCGDEVVDSLKQENKRLGRKIAKFRAGCNRFLQTDKSVKAYISRR